jgi:hypothetical protein
MSLFCIGKPPTHQDDAVVEIYEDNDEFKHISSSFVASAL